MKHSGFQYRLYRRLPWQIQDLLVTHAGRKRWVHENSRKFRSLVDALLEEQFLEPEEIRTRQERRLVSILEAAASTEFYSGMLPSRREIESDPFAVLAGVPVLDREEVRRNGAGLINPSFRGKIIRHGTSGTTGTPLQTFWTRECIDMERALIWRQRMVTGLEFGKEWRGMLGGHQIVPLEQDSPPYWRISRSARQVYFSTYHLSPSTAASYLEALKKYDVKALEGYPSVLYALALGFSRKGLSYPLKGIYYGAEPLQDFQRKLLEEVFQCYVWDYYGLTERVASASEFECKNGLHENWENCILEIVDAKGNPVPEGEYGELAGTSLSNAGFPLLRYRTGDMTRFLPGKCDCGRHSRRIARIDTKREDLLHMPDGALLSASNLTFPFKEVDNILESQLYQNSAGMIQVRIVPAAGYTDSDGKKLLAGLRKMIPGSVNIELVKVESIPRTSSGKFRFCVSDVSRIHPGNR